MDTLPTIIQGGMGVAVSGWRLASAVSREGQLGVVSGTALDVVLARRLQLGDRDVQRAVKVFPDQRVASRILAAYFLEGGKGSKTAFRSVPMFKARPIRRSLELAVVAGFVEVFLAKEGHRGVVGINFLEKVQLPSASTLYGAMLAGVDFVLVGAGIPRDFPTMIDALVTHEEVTLPLHVAESSDATSDGPVGEPTAAAASSADPGEMIFDPRETIDVPTTTNARPRFLAIIASSALAISLTRRGGGGVDGFVIEGPTAGGHNAPPRGLMQLAGGQPVYGPRDVVDLEKIRAVGLPFWLAGGFASPDRLREAQAGGAEGIQVGTAFAFCRESGIDPHLRREVLMRVRRGEVTVVTDPRASPTGFPFKVVSVPGSLSESEVFESRPQRCDLGYLREMYRKGDGTVGYRCPAEPITDFLAKGGAVEETLGRKCVCNGLLATVGYGQERSHLGTEPSLITAGDDLEHLARFLAHGGDDYSAVDVIDSILALDPPPVDERKADLLADHVPS